MTDSSSSDAQLDPRLAVQQGRSGAPVKGMISDNTGYAEEGGALTTKLLEIVPELVGTFQIVRTVMSMKRTDPTVRAMLLALKSPILGGEYYIDPASDQQVDLDAALLVKQNLFGPSGMTIPWEKLLWQMLTGYDYGYYVGEVVYEPRVWAPEGAGRNARNAIMIRKIAPRHQTTIGSFMYDVNGGPAGVKHTPPQQAVTTGVSAVRRTNIEIPISKLLVFTPDQESGSLEGETVLRSAYQHWFYKNHLWKVDAIQKERHGIGIPRAKLPIGANDADRKTARNLLQGIRTNERGYLMHPASWEFDFIKPEGNMVNVLESVDAHDLAEMRSMLLSWMSMGTQGNTGGRSASASQYDLFMNSMQWGGELVCAHFNNFIIPRLVALNFQVTAFPKMKVRGIGQKRDLQMFAAAVANLAKEGFLELSDEVVAWMHEELGIPVPHGPGVRPTISGQQAAKPAPAPFQATPPQPTPGGGSPNGSGTAPLAPTDTGAP